MYIAVVLLFGFAAVNTGNNLLFLVVAAQLGFMAVTGLFGWLNIRRLRVTVSFPDEVYCGTGTLVSVSVETKRSIPSFLVRVHVFDRAVLFPVVHRGSPSTLSVPAVFGRRGHNRVAECAVSSCFPVNFFVRFKTYELNHSLVVFPEPKPFIGIPLHSRDGEGTTESSRRGYEGDMAKIGDYTGTEPRKLIHWRLSAKHDGLKVKEMTALDARPVILDPALMQGKSLEERLSRATYLVNRLVRSNRPVGLKIGDRTVPPAQSRAHRLLLLRELALYDQN